MRSLRRRMLRLTAATGLLASLALPGRVGAQDGTIDLGFADLGLYGPNREVRLLRDSAVHQPLGWAVHTGQITAVTTGAYAWVDSAGVEAGVCDFADLSTVLTRFEGYLVRVDDSGRILVGGWYSSELSGDAHLAVLVRFEPGGLCEPDLAWNGAGIQVGSERCATGEVCRFVDVAYPAFPSGRVYALLETGVNALVSRFFVVALSSEGDPVYAFGEDGFAEVDAPVLGTLAAGSARLETDSSGRPLVYFSHFDPASPLDLDTWVARFTPSGELDPTLSGDGLRPIATADGQDTLPSGFVVEEDRIVLAFSGVPASGDTRLQRFAPDFATVQTHDFPAALVRALAVQGDGKPLVALEAAGDGFSVCRLAATGAPVPDPTFAGDGCAELDVDLGGGFAESPRSLVLDGGRPIVSGLADSDLGDGLFEIRLNNALIFADGFDGGDTANWN